MIIGVSGREASFSEAAAKEWAKKQGLAPASHELRYLVSVDGVLSALTRSDIERGVFPIENQNGGIVIEAVHAMAKYVFQIDELFNFEVKHCLMAKKGMKPSNVTAIASHDQALKQCRMYLKRAWSGVVRLGQNRRIEAGPNRKSGPSHSRNHPRTDFVFPSS